MIELNTTLSALTRERLFDLARVFGTNLRSSRESKPNVVERLCSELQSIEFIDVLQELGRDELREICKRLQIKEAGLKREQLIQQIIKESGSVVTRTRENQQDVGGGLPIVGQTIVARGRQWMVERVEPGNSPNDSPLLKLACLDDDASGRSLELLWNLEVGARISLSQESGLGAPSRLDPPDWFGAYLHALKWNAVSAADATVFQSPFRAGIKLMAHQLTPLMKALELPRANLFIADDVGLGKTIEAGLVMQELILRQQADYVLIVCPASICLQWRDEMMRRFGLRFEIMNRRFVDNRRIERGFGVNPWATHNRFIVSHPLVRRPEYRDPLLNHLGNRARKGLLVLDEAHVAAPASASKYAVDSNTTRALRDLAPKFDNRLFLSATPHNGHSNSFSALLEILDPIRFTRGVPISGPEALTPVMVRRLKRDLRNLGQEQFPERVLVKVSLTHSDERWSVTQERSHAEAGKSTEAATPLAKIENALATELELADLLSRYTAVSAPVSGRGKLVFINLQKRLLSSPEAFVRTLEAHAQSVSREDAKTQKPPVTEDSVFQHSQTDLLFPENADIPEGINEDDLDAADEAHVRATSSGLADLDDNAQDLLKRMRALAAQARRRPDGKALALLAWLKLHCCAALDQKEQASPEWTNRRVLIFTEYGDTKRYLQDLLSEAVEGTDRGDERIMAFHGGMGDDARAEVQKAFNTHPDEHPVRILLATDAAREGVNLQAYCADLFHYDVPWNPARLEQRNGRIDRTLQPAAEVRCHYFVYSQRAEDRVLDTLIRKIDTVQNELGSVGSVLLDDMEATLAGGINEAAGKAIDALGMDKRQQVAERELEAQRKQLDNLMADVQRAGVRLERSRRSLEVQHGVLKGVVDIGLRMAGTQGLEELGQTADKRATYTLPELNKSWEKTLDSLRPARESDESFWEWRQRPLHPVTFEPLSTLNDDAEQLHLAHPFVRRILDRFLAQGFGANDLSRVSGVVVPGESVVRVLAYARLSLFGRGAARLHDEIISVAAPWTLGATTEAPVLVPYKDRETQQRSRQVTEKALASTPRALPQEVAARVFPESSRLFSSLWPALEDQAEQQEHEARAGLARRARKESDELRTLLERQKRAISQASVKLRQMDLLDINDQAQRRQVELDLQHMEQRDAHIEQELEDEPKAIEALYEVRMQRLLPVGLVIAWPESMT